MLVLVTSSCLYAYVDTILLLQGFFSMSVVTNTGTVLPQTGVCAGALTATITVAIAFTSVELPGVQGQ